MPFDGTTLTTKKPDLSRPSLKGLSYLLRHKKEWPKNFRWDYEVLISHGYPWFATINESHIVEGCAIGLAILVWPEEARKIVGSRLDRPKTMARVLKLKEKVARDIFFNARGYPRQVTPKMVADKIDAYLGE